MDDLYNLPVYAFPQSEKRAWLEPRLAELSRWHSHHCPQFRRIQEAMGAFPGQGVEQAVPVHIHLFKTMRLSSVPEEAVFKTLYSSGTGGLPSVILLDRETAARQSKVLVKVMQQWLGRERLPMLILDHPGTTHERHAFSARAAGIKGLSFLGRDHCYALKEDMSLDLAAVTDFARRYQDRPVFLFGFTFMVWRYFLQALDRAGIRLPLEQAILIHSGGWKKLEAQKVSNTQFRSQCQQLLGCRRVHNFYGLVEQIGTIFVECETGHLHCPLFAEIIVRDPLTLAPLPAGQPGVIQLCSVLPRSYPGHLLLTEDLGTLRGEDDCPCGRRGRYFTVQGRLPQTEMRGCSDTFMAEH